MYHTILFVKNLNIEMELNNVIFYNYRISFKYKHYGPNLVKNRKYNQYYCLEISGKKHKMNLGYCY